MRMNALRNYPTTHNGAPAVEVTPEEQLRRSVMACMLWEDTFYESGVKIADRITSLVGKVDPRFAAHVALEARTKGNLRHAPLLVLAALSETARGPEFGPVMVKALEDTILRADELSEFVAIYWRNGKRPLSASVKKGLAKAFRKFNAYQLGKYNRDGAVKLRDVLFLTHAKPTSDVQAETWKKLADGTLESPDTWEVNLSAGKDKGETFTRLLKEGNLGYLALLRNLRNMAQSGVDAGLIKEAILARKNGADRVLPFRFVAAERAVPGKFTDVLDKALIATIADLPVLEGVTTVLVDVSGSMASPVSGKSDISRYEAAATLAQMIPGHKRIIAFGTQTHEVKPRPGLKGVQEIIQAHSRCGGGTNIGHAVQVARQSPTDRLIVITDEQSSDTVKEPEEFRRAYMINVAAYQNGVGYGRKWTHIDGFSESVLRYIHTIEGEG